MPALVSVAQAVGAQLVSACSASVGAWLLANVIDPECDATEQGATEREQCATRRRRRRRP